MDGGGEVGRRDVALIGVGGCVWDGFGAGGRGIGSLVGVLYISRGGERGGECVYNLYDCRMMKNES